MKAVITVTAKDAKGIIAKVSAKCFEYGANIVDISQSVVGEYFAMIMLVVINATSIQLLPTTVIGLRASAGSCDPADIILPTLIVTVTTTVIGILLVHGIEKLRKKIKERKK